jgi:hypothetical protein
MASRTTPETIARSIRAMTIGTIKASNDRRDRYTTDGIGEIDQQVQITVTGKVGASITWGELDIAFTTPFINGSEDRDSPYTRPLFTYGSVVTSGGPLMMVCNVKRWKVDEDYVLGAKLEIAIWAPGGYIRDYQGELHANFQGWGAPRQPEPDTEGVTG